jgi:hypothetical protein
MMNIRQNGRHFDLDPRFIVLESRSDRDSFRSWRSAIGEGRPIRAILKTPNENPAFTTDKEELSGIIEYECRFHLR